MSAQGTVSSQDQARKWHARPNEAEWQLGRICANQHALPLRQGEVWLGNHACGRAAGAMWVILIEGAESHRAWPSGLQIVELVAHVHWAAAGQAGDGCLIGCDGALVGPGRARRVGGDWPKGQSTCPCLPRPATPFPHRLFSRFPPKRSGRRPASI